jgi:hypothetical protein
MDGGNGKPGIVDNPVDPKGGNSGGGVMGSGSKVCSMDITDSVIAVIL